MPKKKNFLGGQQNYNPNNGQYEPALKGPNGESPKGFSSFKKEKDESFDAINKKRMGKEQPKSEEIAKSHKSADRKDKYGNPLVSDDAFKVGQKAAKEYLEESLKYNSLDSLKKSNVFLGYIQDKISDALEQAGLNPDYDLTYQDLNEIIGSVTGEEIDFEDYEGNATKGWTGKKYSGYNPNKAEESTKNETTGRKYDNLFGYSQDEFKKFYEQGKTIIGTSNKFYEIQYSPAQKKFYAAELNYKNNGFAQKGRHYVMKPKDANNVLGKKVFWED